MSRKDSFEFGSSKNKAPKEKPKREKSEGKKLFGDGGSFGGGSSFGKSSSFGGSSSFGKEKKEKPMKEKKEKISFGKVKESKTTFGGDSEKKPLFGGLKREKSESFGSGEKKKTLFGKSEESAFGTDKGNSPKRLKWWHILLMVLGAIIVVVAIIIGILIGKINSTVPGGIGGIVDDGSIDDTPVIEGTTTSIGRFVPNDTQEYILCEYSEYFSSKTTVILQKFSDMKYGNKAYYQLVSPKGVVQDRYSGEYTGEKTPEELKAEIYADVKTSYNVNDEYMATCSFALYQPISFTRVAISSVALDSDGNVTIKYSAGAVDGEMSEEYTLAGTYVKTENDFAFTYTELPEDENLLRVAETLLGSAKYDYYAQYGQWVNELSFGDYALYLTEDDSVGDDTTDDDVVNDDTTDDDVVNDDNVNDDSLDDDTVNDDSSSDDSSDNTL